VVNQKSTSFKHKINRRWHLLDAKTQNFGRLASRIAILLQGKNKPDFSPQSDCGDFVVVTNTLYLRVSHPVKWDKKVYYRYSGHPGGIRGSKLKDVLSRDPSEIIRRAVINMLPKNKLRTPRINRLKLFSDDQEGKELYEAMQRKNLTK